uniref:Ig-like domain-containing protein n=1 Tax=Chrysemys picta bellii TaxID=8478 RepID=A0A8C3H644_CHRPI
PVIAIVGQETVLSCHLSPRMSAVNMEVRWFRSEFSSFVHCYHDGKDQYEMQMPEYRGRTELLKAGLTDGNIALRIFNIRQSDEGLYHCFVQDDTFDEITVLELQVAGLGSAPLISVEGHQNGGIRVVCQSTDWYPEPEVLWRDLSGRYLLSVSETTSRDDNGLFETKTAIIVTEHSNQNLSCCIRNTILNQDKESAISIADPFFPRVNPWMVTQLIPKTHGRICPTILRDLTLSSVCWGVRDSSQGDIAGRWRWGVGNSGLLELPESL